MIRKEKSFLWYWFIFVSLLFPVLQEIPVSAASSDSEESKSTDFFNLSIEELMETPIVVSSSRQEQKISEASTPIYVITAEDIHNSGLTTIPQILQFAPGVDVRRLDRQRYAVGVRGLFGKFSDRTLVLIDGRPVTDIIHGTTHWENLPIMIDDIERIEIVRGSSGATWGANSFTGTINIITKKPDKCQGGLASTTITEFGDSYTSLRYGQTKDKLSWKVTAGYDDVQDSDYAGAGRYYSSTYQKIDTSSFSARDWGRHWKFNSLVDYKVDDQTTWSFGGAHSSGQEGDYEFLRSFIRSDIMTEYTQAFTKLEHQFDSDTNGHIQWFGNFWNTHCRILSDQMTYTQNDIEAQLNFLPTENHKMSFGGNFRWNRIRTDILSLRGENVVGNDDEYWTGIFLMDSWSATDRLTLEGQIRFDNYSETDIDWSARLSALYALDEQHNHILRAGFSRAFRSPSLILRNLTYTSPTNTTVFNPTSDVQNETSYTFEAGYIGKLSNKLQLNIDGYYQRFERMIGVVSTTTPPPPPIVYGTFYNIDGASAYGAECSLSYTHYKGNISAWYAYNDFRTDTHDQSTRSSPPAKHKAGLTERFFIDKNWIFNCNYAFQDAVKYNPGVMDGLKVSHRLDLTLAHTFADGDGEVMVGVSDLLNETNGPTFDPGHFSANETPGKTFFARLQLKF